MPEPANTDDRSLARYFFEQGYFACWADAMAALDAAPFKLTDAGLDRAWDVTPVARDDYAEFAARLALAAAAPELLKACSDWIDWLKPDSPWRDDAADHEARMLDAMRAAISKATSRQPEGER